MAELAVNNLIKIIIGLFVVATVIIGITIGFKSYIIPFFNGIFPSDSENETMISDSFYSKLMKPENFIAGLEKDMKSIAGSNGKYYVKGNEIKEKKTAKFSFNPKTLVGWDIVVGTIGEKTKFVAISKEFISDSFLKKIDGAYFIEGAFRKNE